MISYRRGLPLWRGVPRPDPSDAAWASWEATRGECAAGKHRWGEWWDCQCGARIPGHRLGPDGACAVTVRQCRAICPERQERLPVTADPVSDAFTELIWWLAARPELPELAGEHTEDRGGWCAGCVASGMRRRWPCGVSATLGIAAALAASDLHADVIGDARQAARRASGTRRAQGGEGR